MGWGSESQEEGELAPGKGVESGPHRVEASLSRLCSLGRTSHGKAMTISLLPCDFRGGVQLWICNPTPQWTRILFPSSPPYTSARTHATFTHVHRHTHMHQSLWLSIIMMLLGHWLLSHGGKRFPLGTRAHCPIASLISTVTLPLAPLKCFHKRQGYSVVLMLGWSLGNKALLNLFPLLHQFCPSLPTIPLTNRYTQFTPLTRGGSQPEVGEIWGRVNGSHIAFCSSSKEWIPGGQKAKRGHDKTISGFLCFPLPS